MGILKHLRDQQLGEAVATQAQRGRGRNTLNSSSPPSDLVLGPPIAPNRNPNPESRKPGSCGPWSASLGMEIGANGGKMKKCNFYQKHWVTTFLCLFFFFNLFFGKFKIITLRICMDS